MNEIIFYIYDGCPDEISSRGYITKYTHNAIFGCQEIKIPTKHNLIKGDYVKYKNHTLKIIDRIYYPENDNFTFVCQDVYTGRRE